MHSAPAVSYPVGRSRFHGVLLLLMAVLGGMTVLTWLLLTDVLGARHAVALLLWLASTGIATWQWLKTPAGVLAWDGAAWTWCKADEARSVVPEVTLDLQTFLLLKLHTPSGSGLWVWPERQSAPLHWLPLRRALFGQIRVKADQHQPNVPLAQDLPQGSSA